MGFRLLKSIWNQAFGGVDAPLCKTVLVPLEGRGRPSHTTNSKHFPNISKQLINDHVEMSGKSHQKRQELPGGKVMGSSWGPWAHKQVPSSVTWASSPWGTAPAQGLAGWWGGGWKELVISSLQHLPSHFPVQEAEHCVPWDQQQPQG